MCANIMSNSQQGRRLIKKLR